MEWITQEDLDFLTAMGILFVGAAIIHLVEALRKRGKND